MLTRGMIAILSQRKNRSQLKSAFSKAIATGSAPDILLFYNSLLFHTCSGWGNCPSYLVLLLDSYPLSSFLIERHCGFVLSESVFQDALHSYSLSFSSENCFKLLHFILIQELAYPEIHSTDLQFLKKIFSHLKPERKIELLLLEPISYLQVLLSSATDVDNDFYKFIKLKEMEKNYAFKAASYLNYKYILTVIMKSNSANIKNYTSFFAEMYPEYDTVDKTVSKNRWEYFSNPHCIPMQSLLLRTYVPVVSKINGYDEKDELLLYYHYAEEIMKLENKKKKKSMMQHVLNDWFINKPLLVNLFLKNRPSISSFQAFVRYIPGCIRWAKRIMSYGKMTRDPWYFHLFMTLILQWPTRKHVQLLKENLLYVDIPIPDEIKSLFRNL